MLTAIRDMPKEAGNELVVPQASKVVACWSGANMCVPGNEVLRRFVEVPKCSTSEGVILGGGFGFGSVAIVASEVQVKV